MPRAPYARRTRPEHHGLLRRLRWRLQAWWWVRNEKWEPLAVAYIPLSKKSRTSGIDLIRQGGFNLVKED